MSTNNCWVLGGCERDTSWESSDRWRCHLLPDKLFLNLLSVSLLFSRGGCGEADTLHALRRKNYSNPLLFVFSNCPAYLADELKHNVGGTRRQRFFHGETKFKGVGQRHWL